MAIEAIYRWPGTLRPSGRHTTARCGLFEVDVFGIEPGQRHLDAVLVFPCHAAVTRRGSLHTILRSYESCGNCPAAVQAVLCFFSRLGRVHGFER